MNYGAIGFVIGHEITHGFDDQGRQFDKSGNLVDWWAEETKKRYLEKATCIIRQYGNYTAEEVGLKVRAIDPELTREIIDQGHVFYRFKRFEFDHVQTLSSGVAYI